MISKKTQVTITCDWCTAKRTLDVTKLGDAKLLFPCDGWIKDRRHKKHFCNPDCQEAWRKERKRKRKERHGNGRTQD